MDSYAYQYDHYYLDGNSKYFVGFNGLSDPEADKLAVQILRYCLEYYLHWRPQTSFEKFGPYYIKKMKLEQIIERITFPDYLTRETDYFYYICRCYPDIFPFDEDNASVTIFQLLANKRKARYPDQYFYGLVGRKRAAKCLRYLLTNNYTFLSIPDMYDYFSKRTTKKELSDYGLDGVFLSGCFKTPLEYLHYSLSNDEKNDAIYSKYYFFSKYSEL